MIYTLISNHLSSFRAFVNNPSLLNFCALHKSHEDIVLYNNEIHRQGYGQFLEVWKHSLIENLLKYEYVDYDGRVVGEQYSSIISAVDMEAFRAANWSWVAGNPDQVERMETATTAVLTLFGWN